MKRANFIFLFIFYSFLNSQENSFLLNSNDFQSKLKNKTANSYKNVGFEIEQSEYVAMFQNGNDFLTIRMINLKRFNDFNQYSKNNTKFSGKYLFKNHNIAFVEANKMTAIFIEKLNINAAFEIVSQKMVNQKELEKFIDEIGLLNWEPSENDQISWAEKIPNELRLSGNLIEFKKGDAGTEGYQYAYFVKIQYSQSVIKSIDEIIAKFGGSIDLINAGKITLICSTTDSYEQLKEFKTGEIVEFVYYVK